MGIIIFVMLTGFFNWWAVFIRLWNLSRAKREKHGKHIEKKFPTIDLNNPKHRAAFTFFSVGTILLLLFSAFGSYQGL